MGGGVVLIPALTLLGMPIKQAIAISIISVVATSSGAASAYVRDRLTNLKVGMFLEMFTITGALVGASLTLIAPEQPLYVAFGLVVLGTWSTLLFRRTERLPDAADQDGSLAGSRPTTPFSTRPAARRFTITPCVPTSAAR